MHRVVNGKFTCFKGAALVSFKKCFVSILVLGSLFQGMTKAYADSCTRDSDGHITSLDLRCLGIDTLYCGASVDDAGVFVAGNFNGMATPEGCEPGELAITNLYINSDTPPQWWENSFEGCWDPSSESFIQYMLDSEGDDGFDPSQCTEYSPSATPTPAGPSILEASPTSLVFGKTQMGKTSPSQPLTISNTGLSPATIISLSFGPDSAFSILDDGSLNNPCGTTIQPGSDCSISVAFKPVFDLKKTGTIDGTLTINYSDSSGAGQAAMVPVSGTSLILLPAVRISQASCPGGYIDHATEETDPDATIQALGCALTSLTESINFVMNKNVSLCAMNNFADSLINSKKIRYGFNHYSINWDPVTGSLVIKNTFFTTTGTSPAPYQEQTCWIMS